jgi:hypothetical protein
VSSIISFLSSSTVGWGAGAIGSHVDERADAAHFEQLEDHRVGISQDERFAVLPETATRADENGETGAVHERRVVKIDLDPVVTVENALERESELVCCRQIDLAGDRDNRSVTVTQTTDR